MTAPLDQPGGGQPRAIVGGVRLWAGGAATTLVVALIALVGVLLSRVVGVPGLAGDETGTLAAALINLVAGGVAWVLLLRVGRGAVQDSRRRFLAPPAGGNAARADASASQTGARRPRR